MTGLLTRVMHDRADAAGTPDLDLDAIIATGDQRVHRRRVATGLAGASVAAMVAVAGLAVPSLVEPRNDLVPQAPMIGRGPAWAVGSTVHVGTTSHLVDRKVASFVRTDAGIVYTTPDERVWLYDGATSQELGRAEGHRLRADDSGSVVSWVALAEDGHPQYVVYDAELRREVARVDDRAAGASIEPSDFGAQVFAVDDGSVYWRHDAEIVRYDVSSREESVLSSRVSDLVDVAGGRYAYVVDGETEGSGRWGLAVGPRLDPAGEALAEASHGSLSPDGRLLAAEEHDTMAIYAGDDGQDVTPHLDGYAYVVAYGWVADDVAAVIGLRDYSEQSATGDFLTCDVSDDACDLVSSFDDVPPEHLVLGTGDPVT